MAQFNKLQPTKSGTSLHFQYKQIILPAQPSELPCGRVCEGVHERLREGVREPCMWVSELYSGVSCACPLRFHRKGKKTRVNIVFISECHRVLHLVRDRHRGSVLGRAHQRSPSWICAGSSPSEIAIVDLCWVEPMRGLEVNLHL